ncbi:MAG: nicotinate-nicotinamide nucleotide adenylyltransferase [Myxococcales bacterium]|nr:nicotinate-nicotinamide nucleotide adenylyltransferase [Polyangiaceae bacterium]MDW8251007.1 nicotinate-nicotinamide nucleotide adenylyltransferase [Myxococcales bacterium]
MISKRVAIYGGSFNPPHMGHVLAVTYALAVHPVDAVLVIPCFQHPFAKDLVSFSHRFALCERAFGWLPGVEVSRVEAELGGESRTLRTLEALRERYPSWSFRLLVGADILHDAPQWYAFDRVTELAPLLVLGRCGVVAPGAPQPLLPEVSSTELRTWLQGGNLARARELMPSRVMDYILQHGLYGVAS